MKTLLSSFLVFISLALTAQNMKEYTASNDITYKKGDIITMAEGSGDNDQYLYMWITSALDKGGEIKTQAYNGVGVTIKKIKKFKDKSTEKVLFLVGGGNISNYTLDIENAIASCEIKDCIEEKEEKQEASTISKYDELKKLKELLDIEAITKEEYEKEKKKILENENF